MRRTKEEAEKTRIAILASAERLFLDKGVAHTSLDQIARDAGVTRGAVYWHFQNKAHLFHEMLSQVRLPPEQLTERLSGCDGVDSLLSLRDLCIEAIENLARDEQRRRIFTILLHRCEFTDELRPGAADCVAMLRKAGLRVVLISGDRQAAVADLAARLGITDFHASVDPQGKEAMVADLAAGGARVLMVGDGLNDTAALARAHASISPASALDAARVASDMVLTGSDLVPVAEAVATARRATRRIQENFAISIAYNIVAVPLAVAGMVTPLIAALAMSLSSITVTLNALRLRD